MRRKTFIFLCLLGLHVSIVIPARGQKQLAGIDSLAFVQNTLKKIKKNINFTLIPGPTTNATQNIGFGVLPMLVYNLNPEDKLSPPSSTAALFYFDFNGSWAIALQQKFFWDQNKWRIIFSTGYGDLKVKFFGVGDNTEYVSNNDTNYVWGIEKPFIVSLVAYRKVISHFFAGLEYNYSNVYFNGRDSVASITMESGGVSLGHNIQSKLTPTFSWDSRNNIFWSTSGYYAGFTTQIASKYLASSTAFYILSGFVNGYHRLNKHSDRLSLAWRFYFRGSVGTVPYDQYSNYCSGDRVMGYTHGKYVDYGEVNGQVEVRYDLFKVLGFSGFYSIGKVFGGLNDFGQSVWLPSVGVNAYVTLIPYRNIRMRLAGALGVKDWGVYIGVGQMF